MGRYFDNRPHLNDEFVQCDATFRNFAVTDPSEDHIVAHIMHRIQARRPLPYFGVPAPLV